MKKFQMTIEGKPIVKNEIKYKKVGGKIIPYETGMSATYKIFTRKVAKQLMEGQEIMTGPLEMSVKVYRSYPANLKKDRKALFDQGLVAADTRPSLFDHIEIIQERLTGIVYKNTFQIISFYDTGKWYDKEARVEVEIREAVLK